MSLSGSLEDIRIYNRALAIKEINTLFSSSIPPSNEIGLFSDNLDNLGGLETEFIGDI